jgi:hypothetical protein
MGLGRVLPEGRPVTCPCEQDTLGAIFRDGLRMAFGEPTLARRALTLGVVCLASPCALVLLGCVRVAERLDKRRAS